VEAQETQSDKSKLDAAKVPATASEDATSYVGTPAVGTSKAVAAAGLASVGPSDNQVNEQRRRLAWCAISSFLGAWFIAFLRFFLPRTLFEPPTVFKIGYPSDYSLGIDTKYLGGPHARPAVCHLRALHSSRLYARLEGQRKQIQVSVPR